MPPPDRPKIYHIVHVDRLASIVADGALWSDAALQRRARPGTIIGMSGIKQRRLTNPVKCRPGLNVGDCVPFYFCPRSVMLYLIHRANHSELDYRGGQGPIVHLEADLREAVDWAERRGRRWAFTLSNAGSGYFKDRCDLTQLDEIDWPAIRATDWRACKEGKQAEFLVEQSFPWALVRRVGVCAVEARNAATEAMRSTDRRPAVELGGNGTIDGAEGASMIRFTTGDILAEDAEALVNTVNCIGVMGRGIALQFKKAFPDNFRVYAAACRRGEVEPGRMFVFATGAFTNPRYIINFPTKRHWRGNSRITDIDAGLKDLAMVIRERDIRSIAVPPLGSGLGGLEWSDVRPRIEKALRGFNNVDVVVFEPRGAPPIERMVRGREVPRMSPARAALVGLMDRYLNGLLDPFVSLLEVHKLMYFMQVAGQRLRLRYTEGPYGPYAENLRHLLNEVEGHFISGYGDGGDRPDKQLELVPGAVADAARVLRRSPRTRERFERVADLVDGFESAFGLELLSTVHWVLVRDNPRSHDDLVALTYAWNERKKRFSPRQIGLAAHMLREKGWTDDCLFAQAEAP